MLIFSRADAFHLTAVIQLGIRRIEEFSLLTCKRLAIEFIVLVTGQSLDMVVTTDLLAVSKQLVDSHGLGH